MPTVTNELGTIDVFVNLVSNEILEFEKKKKRNVHNLTKKEMEGLRELERDNERIIKPSEKEDTTYEKFDHNPTDQYHRELKELVMEAYRKKVINADERDFLIPTYPTTAMFYCLPKIHKGVASPPVREAMPQR
ncbi:unnamed protein product [Ranitomeya imitator]|uniref:Uncharacterized protein n=1 Tax=Ranitomeya imitator TaxID=111125 RepID=A0ABN9L5A2_9NEOB|nr:unnamed protein product [Ranitomeya imitator]